MITIKFWQLVSLIFISISMSAVKVARYAMSQVDKNATEMMEKK